MTAPVLTPVTHAGRFGRLWWPPGQAQRALITAMPYLAREAARHGGRAWH